MWLVSWPNCLSASRSASLTALSWVIMPTTDVAIAHPSHWRPESNLAKTNEV